MKHAIAIVIGLMLALGCGGEAYDGPPVPCGTNELGFELYSFDGGETCSDGLDETSMGDDPALEAAIGQLQQALTAPSGYGFISGSSGTICPASHPNTVCDIPTDKKVRFKIDSTVPGVTYNNGWELAVVYNQAGNRVCNYLNARGWDCAATTGSSNELLSHYPSGGNLAGMAPTHFGSTFTSGGNKFRKYNGCWITMYKNPIHNSSAWLNFGYTDTQKGNWLVNLAQHEMYHCAGLAHNSSNATLMNASIGQGLVAQLNPLSSEGTMLQSYAP